MNKKAQEIYNQIKVKKQEIVDLVEQNKVEEAKAAKEELKSLQDKFDLLYDMEGETQEGNDPVNHEPMPKAAEPQNAHRVNEPKDSTKEFANAARRGFVNMMTSGSNEDGGYTVPEDIQTKINKFRDAKASLLHLVKVETVRTKSGQRTYKKRIQQTGFVKVGEGGKIPQKSTPQFTRMKYEIDKYGGWFPVTNDLLKDTDQNITGTLIEWIGDESRVTRNKIILDVVNEKATTEFANLDAIKYAINVTLGSTFKNTSHIITNDDGFQWMDTLKNSDGDYLLKPDVVDKTKYRLFGMVVEVIPNADMPSEVAGGELVIPLIIGDLKEGIIFYDREKTSLLSSQIASAGDLNAFEEDLTLFRAIEREDCRMKDDRAFVNGRIKVDAEAFKTGVPAGE